LSGVRILVAEDENSILKLVIRYLENEGFTVFSASNGEEALDIWLDTPVDLAVLDVMMPKLDGWEVLTEIRKESDIPVIMLTARREETDRLQGFELGTDDYITKPFSPRELVMRVKALLKRTGKLSQSTVIELPGLTVNTQTQSAQTAEGDAKLSAREYELLIYLIDNKGIVLSRDRILERIWGYDYEGDARVLDTTIKRLRSKLGSCGSFIKTQRGNGYMFEVDE
jgi:DNA-binding response OmpR family regulator